MKEPFRPAILPSFEDTQGQLHTETAEQAYQRLILEQEAGANRNAHGFFLDEVDRRILLEAEEGITLHGNGLIDHEKERLPSWEKYDETFSWPAKK